MKLSILIPSKNPDKLQEFLDSYYRHTHNIEEIQLVILVDDHKNYVEYLGKKVIIHRVPDLILNISKLQFYCLELSDGDWIMLGNDDCVIETPHWDDQIFYAMNHFPDGISLIYPNDNMFGQDLACFPVISKKLIDMVKLFPMPYHRYKVDDTIFQLVPPQRRIYLPNCKFTHLNDQGERGHKLKDGRIYPIERKYADMDEKLWISETSRRADMSQIINKYFNIDTEIKVLIGVSTAEMARRAVFYDYFNQLDKPVGTIMTFAHGQSPAKSRNLIIEQALQHGCSHVLFIDDDTAFNPDMLKRLLSHDKDIVTGFYVMRNYPHKPIIFGQREESGACLPYFPKDIQSGLIEIVNAGLGCVLIKTKVFQAMAKPWVTLGELTKDDWCDDISFFNRASDAGFKIYCDLDCMVGHMASVTIWPTRLQDKWHIIYDTTGEGQVTFPMLKPQGVD